MANKQTFEEYGRQQIGTGKTIAPDTSGMRGAMDAQRQYLNGLGNLVGAVGNFANTYLDIVNERKERDADTEISSVFRERRLEIMQGKKGKNVDNLLNDEDAWQKENMEIIREKHGIPANRFKGMWSKYSDPYLDRMGAYQVEQQAAYDKQSRMANAEAGLDTLMNTRIGDMGAVKQYFDQVNQLFPNDPATAEKMKDQGVQTAVKYWSRINPSATVSWFRSNREQIKEAIGKDFIKISDVIHGAEASIRAEVGHAEVLASRQDRLARKAQEQYDNKVYNDSVMSVLGDGFDVTSMHAVAEDPKLSGEIKAKIYNFANKVEKNDFGKASALVHAQYLADAFSGSLDEKKSLEVLNLGAAGKLRPEDIKSIFATRDSYSKNVRTEIRPAVDAASDYIKNYYAPSNGLMGPADPHAQQRYMQVNAAILEYAKDKPLSQLTKDLDFNTPTSWVNTLLKMNAPVKGLSSKPLQLNWTPYIPGEADTVIPAKDARKPGESFSQWNERRKSGK